MHINEDFFYPEIVDPYTGKVQNYGQEGELVLTTLAKEAMPVLRYRTGDITKLNPNPCKCGRTSIRMSKILGRTDDMLIVKGVKVFPTQIESVIFAFKELAPNYNIIVEKDRNFDIIKVHVEMAKWLFSESKGKAKKDIMRILEKKLNTNSEL